MSQYVVGLDPSLTNCAVTVLKRGLQDRVKNPTNPTILDDVERACRPVVLRDFGYSLPDGSGWDEHVGRVASQIDGVRRILDKISNRGEIVCAVIEAPIFHGQMLPSYFDRACLWESIYHAIMARKIPRATTSPTTLKKWATGSGRAEKKQVLEDVSGWWPDVNIANHDIADATVCAAMAADYCGWVMPFERRRRHVEAKPLEVIGGPVPALNPGGDGWSEVQRMAGG